ncbi:MAG: thioredoxin [Marinilabiliales bacterium]|nr:MAG: thioredoxin [Marinilabiliales bacterium]
MKKLNLLFFFVFINFTTSFSQEFEVYDDFTEFEFLLNQQDNKIYVINFWATWCRPCVKEMPAFNQLYENFQDKDVEILLVSMDFGKNLQNRIASFKSNHNIKSKIIILDDPDSNSWIDKVSSDWSGAIPATLIYSKSKREFFEREFEYKELENELKKFL